MLIAFLGETLKKAEEADLNEELFKAVMELRNHIEYVRKRLDEVTGRLQTQDADRRLSELVRQLLESGVTLEEIRSRYRIFGKDPLSPLTDEERAVVISRMERDLAERRQVEAEAPSASSAEEEERQPAAVPVPAPGGGGGKKKKPVVVLVPTP